MNNRLETAIITVEIQIKRIHKLTNHGTLAEKWLNLEAN
jgi:hypothetical protein